MEMQKSGRTSSLVFVAMWFAEQMNDIYDNAIEPAIRAAGYKPIRVDRIEHVNRIDDEIIGRIRASRFIVADFTGHRQGVYFETGMMLGLGRTVIWMCKDDELAASHFDTRQYNFINYKTAEEARKRLHDRIMAIEGAGPEKKDS
jgi:nucleoside 2-deoxyribosyltransferase